MNRKRDRIDIGPAFADTLDQIDFGYAERKAFDHSQYTPGHFRLCRAQRFRSFYQPDGKPFSELTAKVLAKNASYADFQWRRLFFIFGLIVIGIHLIFFVRRYFQVSLDRRRSLVIRKAATIGQSLDDIPAPLFVLFSFERASKRGIDARIAELRQRSRGSRPVFGRFIEVQNPGQPRDAFRQFQTDETADE